MPGGAPAVVGDAPGGGGAPPGTLAAPGGGGGGAAPGTLAVVGGIPGLRGVVGMATVSSVGRCVEPADVSGPGPGIRLAGGGPAGGIPR